MLFLFQDYIEHFSNYFITKLQLNNRKILKLNWENGEGILSLFIFTTNKLENMLFRTIYYLLLSTCT